jgi:cellulose synthase/poly-beta-1,6-N-acetylglucosamine synthase-like glycosyltransferase
LSQALIVPTLLAAAIAFFVLKSRWNYLRLPELPARGADLPRSVTVVIPARNEAANIERAVRSFPGARVVVVNDASEDDTAERARRAGAEVIDAPPLPDGWLGKPHACWAGAQAAHTPWILFVDADTWFAHPFLASLTGYAEQEQLDVATAFLRQERHSAAEHILLPYAFGLYFCGVSARSVNRVGGGEALANGQCLLFRREAYFRIGGHAAVAGSIIEDVDLAALAKQHGLRLRVVRAEALGAVRMYDSLGAILRGFEKNSFRFLVANPAGGVQVILASMLLLLYAPLLAYLIIDSHPIAATALAFLPSLLFLPWYGNAWALAAPLAIYLFHMVAMKGMFSTLFQRKVLWKGRPV